MSKPIIDQKFAMEQARANGFQVVRSSPRRLLLDIDDDNAMGTYVENLAIIQEDLDVVEVERWQSKSGGWHVKLRLPHKLPVAQRALLQAILGSDLMREWYSLLRLWTGKTQEPHLLFRPKGKRAAILRNKDAQSCLAANTRSLVDSVSDDDVPF